LLAGRELLIADGAMGTNLFLLGLANGAPGELWNVEQPDSVRSVHQGFIDAGADIILTNTFGANRFRFALHRLSGRVRELNLAAAALARDLADKAGRPVIVAGDMGPTGDVLEPLGPRTAAQAEEAFHEQAEALRDGGAHIAWIETMFADAEIEAAIKGAQRAGLPVVATMTFDTGGRTMMGVRPADAIKNAKGFGAPLIAFGANCGIGPAQLLDSVLGLAQGAAPGDVIVAKSNCGLPVMGEDMKVRYDGTPQVMADYACLARDAGARIIGGCCGTTPAHLRSMVQALTTRERRAAPGYDEIESKLGPVRKRTAEGEAAPRRRPVRTP
jgi:5-methyltetrahydrofolate--homocysteine methyltransferase